MNEEIGRVQRLKLIQDLENLTRSGQFEKVREILRGFTPAHLHRQERLKVANVARRVGYYRLALRILNPIVRPPKGVLGPTASVEEKIEYAESLCRLGALGEAEEILLGISPDSNPKVLFHLALCRVAQWDYASTIPLLERYIAGPAPDSYARLVAEVNLAAALIHEGRLDLARTLLVRLVSSTGKPETSLLHGNCLELRAQLEIRSRNWQAALASLKEARDLLKATRGAVDNLLIDKWEAIAQSMAQNQVNDRLLELCESGERGSHSEIWRDSEFYRAWISRDTKALVKLYFGTPFAGYRARIKSAIAELKGEIPQTYLWRAQDHVAGSLEPAIFSLETGQMEANSQIRLPTGQALHKMLILLCEDFYRPVRLVWAFSRLFPGEHFNPESSPNRVHQVLRRLRLWFSEHRLGFDIIENGNGYKLTGNGICAIRIPHKPLPQNRLELELLQLLSIFQNSPFSAQQAAEALNVSPATAQRLMKSAVESNKLVRLGRGPKTLYKSAA